eukprot:scaffold28900_cov93-Cyclotella_meneghiniana.AAC.3
MIGWKFRASCSHLDFGERKIRVGREQVRVNASGCEPARVQVIVREGRKQVRASASECELRRE